MSYARDDMVIAKDLAAYSVNYTDLKTVTTTEKSQKTRDAEELEILELSESFDQKVQSLEDPLVEMQRGQAALQIAQEGLTPVVDNLVQIEEMTQNVSDEEYSTQDYQNLSEEIRQKVCEIDDHVESIEFEGKKILKGELEDSITITDENDEEVNVSSSLKDSSSEALGFSQDLEVTNEEEAKELNGITSQSIQDIEQRQEDIDSDAQKIVEAVDGTIELDETVTTISYNINEDGYFEKVKDDAIKDIASDPDNSIKVQINLLNPDMILALLSVTHG